MPGDDARAVVETQDAAERRELVTELSEQLPPQILEVFQVRLADLAQQQAFQPRHALAIVHAHLAEQPMRLPTAPGATIADRCGPVGVVAQPRRRTGHKLALLQDHVSLLKAVHLVFRTARPPPDQEIPFPRCHGFTSPVCTGTSPVCGVGLPVCAGSCLCSPLRTSSTSTTSPGRGSP